MDFKKILIISLVLVAIFASLSVASAGLIEDIFGGSDQNVTIEGENFTIPSGFEENVNESYEKSYGEFNTTYRYYEDLTNYISITVDSYNSESGAKDVGMYDAAVNKTISHKTGHFVKQGDECMFIYRNGTKLVTVSTSDEECLQKVIR